MGESTNARGIRSFQPDETATEFFIDANRNPQSLGKIIDMAREKWGNDIDINELQIEPDYIHTDCLGYDSYDPGDYTNFLRIEYDPQ